MPTLFTSSSPLYCNNYLRCLFVHVAFSTKRNVLFVFVTTISTLPAHYYSGLFQVARRFSIIHMNIPKKNITKQLMLHRFMSPKRVRTKFEFEIRNLGELLSAMPWSLFPNDCKPNLTNGVSFSWSNSIYACRHYWRVLCGSGIIFYSVFSIISPSY